MVQDNRSDLIVLSDLDVQAIWGGGGGFYDMIETIVGEIPGMGLIEAAFGEDVIGLDPHEQGPSSETKIQYGDGSDLPNA